ncbi:hypothetical protein M422DRAFT_242314 [Sphaerobolus stellatus SS14]|nr:hypothetical protein M422DRAFT_242314 [Sphaerobolus stellatus SS14]
MASKHSRSVPISAEVCQDDSQETFPSKWICRRSDSPGEHNNQTTVEFTQSKRFRWNVTVVQVFEDMFALPQNTAEQEMVDGSPLIRLHDKKKTGKHS